MFGISTLTSKGQATIPEPLRSYLGLVAGDKVYFEADLKEKTVNVKKASTQNIVDELYGSLKTSKPYEDYAVVRQKAGVLLAEKYGLVKKK